MTGHLVPPPVVQVVQVGQDHHGTYLDDTPEPPTA